MLQIDNHKELALQDVIPYLLQFSQIYNLTSLNGDRSQAIEDVIWKLLYSLDYQTANGVWLDYIGKKVGQDRVYTPVPTGAFTFGGTNPEGFGAGRFKGVASVRSTKIARSDASFRNAIKAKIIQNNTDTSLDELITACKLLFNASLVRITESYPANIGLIKLYGSSLLEVLDANSLIKNALPAGVSINQVTFHKFYNLFKNNAFITYNGLIPKSDDFELSMTITPDELPSSSENIGIFSQNGTFDNEYSSVSCFYNNVDGFVFKTSPSQYSDNSTASTKYTDGEGNIYVDSDGDVILTGGSMSIDDNCTLRITRVGNIWSMYVNGVLVDSEISDHKVIVGDDIYFYLGTSENKYYNSGSIYSFYLRNNTTGELIINDALKANTIGINNGVRFI